MTNPKQKIEQLLHDWMKDENGTDKKSHLTLCKLYPLVRDLLAAPPEQPVIYLLDQELTEILDNKDWSDDYAGRMTRFKLRALRKYHSQTTVTPISIDHFIDFLEREPQHKPRLAALLKDHQPIKGHDTFHMGQRVRKKGDKRQWHGHICGSYSASCTRYAVRKRTRKRQRPDLSSDCIGAI